MSRKIIYGFLCVFIFSLTTSLAEARNLPSSQTNSAPVLANADANWVMRSPTTLPSPRARHGMTYDSHRGVVVLFGGTNQFNQDYGDTWEWDGSNWTQRFPAHAPSPRSGIALTYDSIRRVAILFGGNNVNDTWEWNGIDWVQRFPSHSPSPRMHYAVAFDSRRGVTVLFGGYVYPCSTGDTCHDTWEYDGNDWTQRFPATVPPGQFWHSMAYDSRRGVTVMFGGRGDLGAGSNETWEWDGHNWTKRVPSTKPPIRSQQSMIYDSYRGVTVMFGGRQAIDFNDTWEWDGTIL